jgi:hypothetical protein
VHREDGPNLPFDDDSALHFHLARCAKESTRFVRAVRELGRSRQLLAQWHRLLDGVAEQLATITRTADPEQEAAEPDAVREREVFLRALINDVLRINDQLPAPPKSTASFQEHPAVQAVRRYRAAYDALNLFMEAPLQRADEEVLREIRRAYPAFATFIENSPLKKQMLRYIAGTHPRPRTRMKRSSAEAKTNEAAARHAAAIFASAELGIEPTTFLRDFIDRSPTAPTRRGGDPLRAALRRARKSKPA